jgi:hypothetical protein
VAERENPDLVATDDPVPVESKDADLIATDDPVLVDGKVEPASAPRTGATIGVGSRQPTF